MKLDLEKAVLFPTTLFLYMKHTVAWIQSPQCETEKENYVGRILTPVSHYMNDAFVSGSHENVSNKSPKRDTEYLP